MQQQVVKEKKDRRVGKGRAIALSRRIYRTAENLYAVESESADNRYYTVKYNPNPTFVQEWCTCLDYNSNRATKCKHIYAVQTALKNNTIQVIEKLPKHEESRHQQHKIE